MTTAFQIVKPTVEDAANIAELVNTFSSKGILLPRSVNDVYESLRNAALSTLSLRNSVRYAG